MKKLLKLIFILLIVTVGCLSVYIWKKGDSIYPEFKKMEHVRLSHVGLFPPEIRISADAVFHHNNPVSITLSRMELNVQIEDLEAAEVIQRSLVNINPASDFTVPLNIKIPIKGNEVLGHLKSLIKKSQSDGKLKYHLDGKLFFSIHGAEIGIPIDYTDFFETRK